MLTDIFKHNALQCLQIIIISWRAIIRAIGKCRVRSLRPTGGGVCHAICELVLNYIRSLHAVPSRHSVGALHLLIYRYDQAEPSRATNFALIWFAAFLTRSFWLHLNLNLDWLRAALAMSQSLTQRAVLAPALLWLSMTNWRIPWGRSMIASELI